MPFVLFFALIGAYIGQNNPTELLMMIGCGALAVVFRFTGYPLPPLVIGFILGGMMEDNLGRAIRKAGGLQFLWERPMTLTLLILSLLLLVAPYFFGSEEKISGGDMSAINMKFFDPQKKYVFS